MFNQWDNFRNIILFVWKSLYPDYIDEEKQYGYAEDPELENRIKDISAEISAGASDDNLSSKASKRPRKTRLH